MNVLLSYFHRPYSSLLCLTRIFKKRGGENGLLSVNENAEELLNIHQTVETVPLQVNARNYAGAPDKLSQ